FGGRSDPVGRLGLGTAAWAGRSLVVQPVALPHRREEAAGMTGTATFRPLARTQSELARPLGDAGPIELVGGKAHNLCRAIHLGLEVPEGFVLTSRALDEHLERPGLMKRIGEEG